MNILTNLWNTWSTYEKITEASFLFLIFGIVVFAIYYTTRSKNITLLSIIAFVLSAILNVVGLVLTPVLFSIEITEIFRLTPVITSILITSNVALLAGFYIASHQNKNFKYSTLRAEYFGDTAKQTIFLVLLALSILLFVSPQTEAILAISILSTLIPVWIVYWISKYTLHD